MQDIISSHLELVQRKGGDSIPKILDYAKYHSFTPKVGWGRGRDSIPKMLHYAIHHSFTPRVRK